MRTETNKIKLNFQLGTFIVFFFYQERINALEEEAKVARKRISRIEILEQVLHTG